MDFSNEGWIDWFSIKMYPSWTWSLDLVGDLENLWRKLATVSWDFSIVWSLILTKGLSDEAGRQLNESALLLWNP